MRVLDAHLAGPGEIRLMGGAALILGYGMPRSTEDADLLMETAELEALVEEADLGEALEATNAELAAAGLYISHIWGPEQQILTPEWRNGCRPIALDPPLVRLRLTVLGPLDLVLSKLCRADDGDLADIRWLVARESLAPEAIRDAMARATVPPEFRAVYGEAVARVEREVLA